MTVITTAISRVNCMLIKRSFVEEKKLQGGRFVGLLKILFISVFISIKSMKQTNLMLSISCDHLFTVEKDWSRHA